MAEYQQTGPFSRQSAVNVERLPGQFWGALQGIGRQLGRTGKYLSSEKAATDYTKLLSGQIPAFGRPALANELVGPPAPEYYGPGFGPEKIVLGTRDGKTPDRTQSDTYKQYAFTPSGQFERYFKTPEMDQYFGAASRGATAPKDVEAMQALAGKTVAPGKTPEELAGFYRAESALGRAQMPQIQEGLGYAKGSPLAEWAEKHPMLAQRLYAQKQAKGEIVGKDAYAGAQPQAFTAATGGEDFSSPANTVPAPWDTQGIKVSAPFADVTSSQFNYTTGTGMPDLRTTGAKVDDYLKGIGALASK